MVPPKPSEETLKACSYLGLNICPPQETCHVVRYMKHVRDELRELKPSSALILCGGSGLYAKALLEGISGDSEANPALREELEARYEEQGLSSLQEELKKLSPLWWEYVDDHENPRRLIRAIEQAQAGSAPPENWGHSKKYTLVGLRMERSAHRLQITKRVEHMYEEGFLQEVENLLDQAEPLSVTAEQAIGYKEAIAHLKGECSLKEAQEKTITRTGQYAKRQMTWFTNQFQMEWIDVLPTSKLDELAQALRHSWAKNNPIPLSI